MGATPASTRSLRTTRLRWSRGEARSNAACSMPRACAEWSSCRAAYGDGGGLNRPSPSTEAAAVAVGAPGAVPGSDDEARARLGEYFAEVLLLDQSIVATRARDELGWHPSRPGLGDEFRNGSYRGATTA